MYEDPRTFRETNRREYASLYYQMRWLETADAMQAEERRAALLASLGDSARMLCRGSKPCLGELSPGCRHCAAGTWSCLFINNRCNASCFFCPARQENDDTPSTSTLTFPAPADFADYCGELGIRGISISGGEPLLALDRALDYLRECKKRFGGGCHFWLYTNGTLAKEDTFRLLAGEGIDEIRFNITARSYRTDLVEQAARFIPTVTVEIPAVPEDSEKLKTAMTEMASAGARYLNLHQIRCTTYNCHNLIERDYSFLHGPHASVLESELAALEAMSFAADQKIPLAVNYCSFIYRHRFQGDAASRRAALKSLGPLESVTSRGVIRSISVKGGRDALARAAQTLEKETGTREGWEYDPDRGEILVLPENLVKIPPDGLTIGVRYDRALLSEDSGEGNALMLDSGKKLHIRRRLQVSADLEGDEASAFIELLREKHDKEALTADSIPPVNAAHERTWREILSCERVPYGLQNYGASSIDADN